MLDVTKAEDMAGDVVADAAEESDPLHGTARRAQLHERVRDHHVVHIDREGQLPLRLQGEVIHSLELARG